MPKKTTSVLIILAVFVAGWCGAFTLGSRCGRTTPDRGDHNGSIKASLQVPTPPVPIERWGDGLDECVEHVRKLAGPAPSFLRLCIAANVLVASMPAGPKQTDWTRYLDEGLWSCAIRAEVMRAIVVRMSPNAKTRHAGMATVPVQGAHSVLEVFIPSQNRWGYFDPSTGAVFTRDGTLNGQVLSMQEVFFRPEIVDDPGPIVPSAPRAKGAPHDVDLGDNLDTCVVRKPGFKTRRFPMKAIFSEARCYGSYIPGYPLINPVYLKLGQRTTYDGLRVIDGRLTNKLGAHKDGGRYISWLNRAGTSNRGLNVIPAYIMDALSEGREYSLAITFARIVPAQGRFIPLNVIGCRLLERAPKLTKIAIHGKTMTRMQIRFRARQDRAIIMIVPDPYAEARLGSIGRIELTRQSKPR